MTDIEQLSISEMTSSQNIVALQIKRLLLAKSYDFCIKIKSSQYPQIYFKPLINPYMINIIIQKIKYYCHLGLVET